MNYLKTHGHFIFLTGVCFSLLVAQVILLNQNSTDGERLSILLDQIQETENENSILKQYIASGSALTTIAQVAKNTGFAESKQVLSLNTPLPLALSKGLSY